MVVCCKNLNNKLISFTLQCVSSFSPITVSSAYLCNSWDFMSKRHNLMTINTDRQNVLFAIKITTIMINNEKVKRQEISIKTESLTWRPPCNVHIIIT